ncbi:MAG: HAD family hydrolase [Anaeroplasmataceae bacterium]
MKKMIVIDLDGTLLNKNGEISTQTIKYLEDLIEKNYILVLASGRPYRGMLKYASLFPANTPLISENGAFIGSMDNSINTDLKAINPKSFLKLFKDNKSIIKSANFSTRDKVFIYNRLAKLEPFYHIEPNTIVVEGAFDEIDEFEAPNGVMLIIESSKRREFEEYVDSNFSIDLKYRLIGYDTKNAIYELTEGLTDKSIAVKKLLNLFNIDAKDLIVFGDGENDIEMLELTKNSIAMLNSNSLVKEKAAYITQYDNNNDGVYYFLKEFLDQK